MKLRAVLDASALLGPARHELVFLARKGVYTMVWSSFLIAELTRQRTEWAIRQSLDRVRYRGRINALIRELSQIAVIMDYTRLEGGNYQDWLRDPDDEPLLATALVGRAAYVVSHNTSDFPPKRRIRWRHLSDASLIPGTTLSRASATEATTQN